MWRRARAAVDERNPQQIGEHDTSSGTANPAPSVCIASCSRILTKATVACDASALVHAQTIKLQPQGLKPGWDLGLCAAAAGQPETRSPEGQHYRHQHGLNGEHPMLISFCNITSIRRGPCMDSNACRGGILSYLRQNRVGRKLRLFPPAAFQCCLQCYLTAWELQISSVRQSTTASQSFEAGAACAGGIHEDCFCSVRCHRGFLASRRMPQSCGSISERILSKGKVAQLCSLLSGSSGALSALCNAC